jgi:hypothetical protein
MGFSPVHKIHQKPLPFNKAFLCIKHPKCKMADMSSNDFFNDIWGIGGKKNVSTVKPTKACEG